MRRKGSWPELLDAHIRQNQNREYKHGVFDCVTFGAKIIKSMTDVDILVGVEYHDMKSAMALLKKHGGLFRMTSSQMDGAGFKAINPKQAKRGDIVGFMTKKHGETVGICIGNDLVSPGENELVYLPMTDAVKAWEII